MSELVHAKMERATNMEGTMMYQLSMVFGSPIVDGKGHNIIANGRTVNMTFMNGMPPDDFVVGLRALADHIESEVKDTGVNDGELRTDPGKK